VPNLGTGVVKKVILMQEGWGSRLTHTRRPYVGALVGLVTLVCVLGPAARTAWAEDIPDELIPDPTGELKLFDAAGNQVDYSKLNKITDPYNQNILKGDFPIDGKHLYFVFNGIQDANFITGRSFLGTTVQQNAALNNFDFTLFDNVTTSIEFFSGTTAVQEPKRWDFVLTPVFNWNNANGDNNQPFVGFQNAFGAVKLADLSPFFDAATAQFGIFAIKNDFEGFIYNDQNRHGEVFATLNANETAMDVFYADRVLKDAVSGLNTGNRRNDEVGGLNYQINDIRPGLDLNLEYTNNQDTQLGEIKNKFNPNAAVSANYMGAAIQGVLGRFDISAGATYVTGRDGNNILTHEPGDIEAGMGFIKMDYPINFLKPHAAYLWASGNNDPTSGKETGYDSINDGTNFFGGQFSFFEGNNIAGTFDGKNVFLVRANSVIPSLRNGNQTSNFVNPGLIATNFGIDVQVHPKVVLTTNYNSFSFQSNTSSFGLIDAKLPALLNNHIADEFNFGFTIRPGLADDFQIQTGVSFTSFDAGLANAIFGGQGNVTSFLLRVTTTY